MSERITVTIETGTYAFRRKPNAEVARILRGAADQLEQGHENRPLRDHKGNVVGWIKIEPLAQP